MKITFSLLIILNLFTTNAQSWQWGKRGGATDVLNDTGDLRREEVYSIATDSQNNIYVLSAVGKNQLDVDGNPKTNFGDNGQITDVVLASFSCDGTYRWSKVIGGKGFDRVNSVQIDSQDNIYIAGWFGGCQDAAYPPRIDNDIILPQNPVDCSVNFIAKYNSNGVLQWFKRPQPTVGSINAFSKGLTIDSAGTSYWIIQIPPGTYADGAYTNSIAGNSFHIFKYDTNGNFISAMPIDMQLNPNFGTTLQFARNPYNGFFYFTSIKYDSTDTAVVGGQNITHTAFIACFNDVGAFQWVREDTTTTPGSIDFYNLAFDSDNNIYMGGMILGSNFNSFIGFSVPEVIQPSFIMKVNPNATSLIWSSYNNNGTLQRGAILVNNNEVAYTSHCAGTNFTWGSQTLNASGNNQGTEALLARFNKTTGACIALSKIPGNIGPNDWGTALAVDSSGDYILGGGTAGTLTFDTNTTVFSGSQSDFFVAKYSSSPCLLGTESFENEGLQLYPNPADNEVRIDTTEKLDYVVYSMTGNVILEGVLSESEHTIDVGKLAAGCYLVVTKNADGKLQRSKLLKR